MTPRLRGFFLPVMAAAVWLLGAGGGAPVQAEPAFAARTGYSCKQCHINRTGGGMRTSFGSLYTQTVLPESLLPLPDDRSLLLPADPDARLGYGADLRFNYSAIYSDNTRDTSSFEISSADLYGMARLFPGRFAAYVDLETGSGGTAARELFGILSSRSGAAYLKVGKFIPPYGWALPDDSTFVREPLGFAFSAPENGIQAGYEPANWSFHVAMVNGNAGPRDDDEGKKFTMVTERRFDKSRIGVSSAFDRSRGDDTTWAGLFGSVNLGRLALLAEGDWRRASPGTGPTIETEAALFEADLLISRGLNLKYAHDWIDPDKDVHTDQRQRDTLGFEYMPYPFVQLRLAARRLDGPKQIPATRDDQLELEIHLFF